VNDVNKPIRVNRILVSLDSSKHSFAALNAAIDLAHHYDAALKGVFIEDITLLSLAEMPFRQEVGEYSAIVREISTDGITRGILVQGRWVIQTFRKLVNQTEINGDFAILRGKVSEIIARESKECDLLVLGKSGTNSLLRRRLGSTARTMIRRHKKPLLLVEEDNRLGYPLIVLYDKSPLGQISLETARDLLDPGESLIILLNEDDPEAFNQKKQRLSEWASEKQIKISIQTYQYRSFSRFLQQIHGVKTGLFILPNIHNDPKGRIVDWVLEKVSLPILLIRRMDSSKK
jgi:nucleotide-binding universal stress UspA family protein